MKVFRDLHIRVPEDQVENFVSQLEVRLSNSWKRDRQEESKASMHFPKEFFYFVCEKKPGREAALLALVQRDEATLYVSNVVPREKRKLSLDEYNTILKEFHDEFVKPVADKLGIHTLLSSDQQTLEDWVSQETATKLRTFSAAANKSTGSSHPSDEERWFDFIISIVRNNEKLDTETLCRWLVEEEGWAPDIADQLAIQYEQGVALLRYNKGH